MESNENSKIMDKTINMNDISQQPINKQKNNINESTLSENNNYRYSN